MTLTIGQLARAAGVNVQTVRYYERRGLVTPAAQRDSGYRKFERGDVDRLRFIKRAQGLGFSLEEIGELLSLRAEGGDGCEDVRLRAEAKLGEVETRLADLQRLRGALADLVDTCRRRAASEPCPILTALDTDAEENGPCPTSS